MTWADLNGAAHPKQAGRGKTCFTLPFTMQPSRSAMDKFWSIFTMPLGVAMCFGPAMLIWWFTKGNKLGGDGPDQGH